MDRYIICGRKNMQILIVDYIDLNYEIVVGTIVQSKELHSVAQLKKRPPRLQEVAGLRLDNTKDLYITTPVFSVCPPIYSMKV